MFVGLIIPTSRYFIFVKMIHIQRHGRKTFFFKMSSKPHSGTQVCKRPILYLQIIWLACFTFLVSFLFCFSILRDMVPVNLAD